MDRAKRPTCIEIIQVSLVIKMQVNLVCKNQYIFCLDIPLSESLCVLCLPSLPLGFSWAGPTFIELKYQLSSSKKTNLDRAKRPTWIEQKDLLGSSKTTNLHRNYPSLSGYQNASEFGPQNQYIFVWILPLSESLCVCFVYLRYLLDLAGQDQLLSS